MEASPLLSRDAAGPGGAPGVGPGSVIHRRKPSQPFLVWGGVQRVGGRSPRLRGRDGATVPGRLDLSCRGVVSLGFRIRSDV